MKDVLGRELKIGDDVVITGYNGQSLTQAKVVGFTPKMIKVQTSRHTPYTKQPSYVAKVDL
jgi:hypothetical protein